MEIKSRKNLAENDTMGLKQIASAIGDRWRGGLVIYPGDVLKRLTDPQIRVVPFRRIFA